MESSSFEHLARQSASWDREISCSAKASTKIVTHGVLAEVTSATLLGVNLDQDQAGGPSLTLEM